MGSAASWPATESQVAYSYVATAFSDELEEIAGAGDEFKDLAQSLLDMADASDPAAEDLGKARIAAARLAQLAVDGCDIDGVDSDGSGQIEPPPAGLGRCARVYMEPLASSAQIEAVQAALQDVEGLESLDFIDQEAAFAEFQRLFADQPDLVEGVQLEQLPSSFIAERDEPWDADQISHLEAIRGVRQVRADEDACG